MTTHTCLNCGERPQATKHGWCTPCQAARTARVRASIRAGMEQPPTTTDAPTARAGGQTTFAEWDTP